VAFDVALVRSDVVFGGHW